MVVNMDAVSDLPECSGGAAATQTSLQGQEQRQGQGLDQGERAPLPSLVSGCMLGERAMGADSFDKRGRHQV